MKPDLESLGMLRVKAILLLGAVFVIGAFAGAAVERARESRSAPPPIPRGGLPPGLSRDLDLSDSQERQIREILERNRPRVDSLLDQFMPRLRALTDSARAEVRGTLNHAQQATFDRLDPPLGPPIEGRPRPGGRMPGGGPPRGGGGGARP